MIVVLGAGVEKLLEAGMVAAERVMRRSAYRVIHHGEAPSETGGEGGLLDDAAAGRLFCGVAATWSDHDDIVSR